MPNFTTNQKFLENFVLIFAKDNTDCFLFCNLGSTLLKREDLLKFVFFFEVAYIKNKVVRTVLLYLAFFGHEFLIIGIFGNFFVQICHFSKITLYFVTDSDPDRTEF